MLHNSVRFLPHAREVADLTIESVIYRTEIFPANLFVPSSSLSSSGLTKTAEGLKPPAMTATATDE
jgi:hypothetical protein